MKRFIFSAFSVMLAAGAIAPNAAALPQVDNDFNVHTLRLSELDTRNKSDSKIHILRLSELDARNKSDSKIHTLRLSEFDARNKGEETYYPYGQEPEQASEWTTPQDATAEQGSSAVNAETAEPAAAEAIDEEDTQSRSVAERRQEVLDRS